MCLTDIMRRTNMKYTPSINIAQTTFNPAGYIVTQNALGVIGNIVDSFNAGVHSFNIIGSYGTGKSNFILALEHGVSIRPRACFFPLFSFLPLWLHYNLNPLCVQY